MDASRRGAGFGLAVPFAINLLNFYDRQALGPLARASSAGNFVTSTQLGLLGTIFTLLYAVVGVPFGRLADSWSRKKLLALGLIVWSSLTGAASLATSYAMLVVTRIWAWEWAKRCARRRAPRIGDLVPQISARARSAFFMMAVPLGTATSYMSEQAAAKSSGWRTALVIAALPADRHSATPALIFTVRESHEAHRKAMCPPGHHISAWSPGADSDALVNHRFERHGQLLISMRWARSCPRFLTRVQPDFRWRNPVSGWAWDTQQPGFSRY